MCQACFPRQKLAEGSNLPDWHISVVPTGRPERALDSMAVSQHSLKTKMRGLTPSMRVNPFWLMSISIL